MVTLWPIPEEAREALKNGEHVKLEGSRGGGVVIGFEEHVNESFELCNWEIDDGWQR